LLQLAAVVHLHMDTTDDRPVRGLDTSQHGELGPFDVDLEQVHAIDAEPSDVMRQRFDAALDDLRLPKLGYSEGFEDAVIDSRDSVPLEVTRGRPFQERLVTAGVGLEAAHDRVVRVVGEVHRGGPVRDALGHDDDPFPVPRHIVPQDREQLGSGLEADDAGARKPIAHEQREQSDIGANIEEHGVLRQHRHMLQVDLLNVDLLVEKLSLVLVQVGNGLAVGQRRFAKCGCHAVQWRLDEWCYDSITIAKRSGLAAGEVHVWCVRPADVPLDDLVRWRDWMTREERDRCERFVFEELRRDFVITRWLLRSTLSRYIPIAPEDWRFDQNEHGRPHVATPAGRDLHFNLSHTDGLIVCVLADCYEVGIDVEQVTRRSRTLAIADRFFSPSEVEALRRLPVARQAERFFQYWTLKESYIKARGMGLRLPLDQFSFDLSAPADDIRIAFGVSIDDDPGRWQFGLFRPAPLYQLAVAVARRPAGRSFLFADALAPQ